MMSLASANAHDDSVDRLRDAGAVLKQIMDAPDKGIPEEVFDNATCVVVVPNLVKGGFIVGGKHGRGVATCRTGTGWSAPAFVSVGGGSWGLQIGVEGVDLVMLVMNDAGLQHLLSSKFQISGEGSAAAGPVGLTYSRSKGVFAGLTLEGAVIEPDEDSTRAIYGTDKPFRSILAGQVPAPDAAQPFLAAVRDASRQAVGQATGPK
jgi:lipid-binding SYLF domain-containing protein